MKYEVTVKQHIQYHETLIAMFDSLAEVDSFINTIMEHCEGIYDIRIIVHLPETEEEEEVEE